MASNTADMLHFQNALKEKNPTDDEDEVDEEYEYDEKTNEDIAAIWAKIRTANRNI